MPCDPSPQNPGFWLAIDSLVAQSEIIIDRLCALSVGESGKCLKANLEKHTNELTQLRLFNLFCGIQVIRYLSLLEAFYCDGSARPMLLDFSKQSYSSIARTSVLCCVFYRSNDPIFAEIIFEKSPTRSWGIGCFALLLQPFQASFLHTAGGFYFISPGGNFA
jgi:hypothetical protein